MGPIVTELSCCWDTETVLWLKLRRTSRLMAMSYAIKLEIDRTQLCVPQFLLRERERERERERTKTIILHCITVHHKSSFPSGAWIAVIPWMHLESSVERETKYSTAMCSRTATTAEPSLNKPPITNSTHQVIYQGRNAYFFSCITMHFSRARTPRL